MIFNPGFFVRQHDSKQCGAACFAMICNIFGRNMSLFQAEDIVQAGSNGTSATSIIKAAQKLGMNTKLFRCSINDIASMECPMILHWNQNHFVVLYRISKNGRYLYIADPGKTCSKLSIENIRKHWISTNIDGIDKGIALSFEKPSEGDAMCQKSKAESPRKAISLVVEYAHKYRLLFFYVLAALFLSSILQLCLPFLTQFIVDIGIHNADIGFIWLVLLGEMMILLGRSVTEYIRSWVVLHISMRINISLISDYFIRLVSLPMRFFESKNLGDLIQRLHDYTRVQDFISTEVLNMLFTTVNLVVFSCVLFFYDKLILCVFIIFCLIYSIWVFFFLDRRKQLDYESFDTHSKIQDCTFQMLSSMAEIKVQGCGKRRRWEWEEGQADLYHNQMKSLKLQQMRDIGSIFINELKNMLVTVLSATAVINGNLSFGEMLAIQYIIGQVSSPIIQLIGFINTLQDISISMERMNDVTTRKSEKEYSNNINFFDSHKSIYLDNISFRYDVNLQDPVIKNLSCIIPENKVTAIVGASGSGKTTLLKLLLGFYHVEEGVIKVSERKLQDYDIDWWRSRCGVVLQDGVIFSESIKNNIAIADDKIDMKKVIKAAKIACIDDYVQSLPLGYDTLIGKNGYGLSIGQKQRILIARAVYKDPDFFLLDEATNSLDATNEKNIVDNLANVCKGKTVVIIAHRLSTVKNADQIIVLDNGSIVETGNHESLSRKKGLYYSLVKNQLELGK